NTSVLESQRFTWEAWARPDGAGPNNDNYGSTILAKAVTDTFGYALNWRSSDSKFVFLCGDQNSSVIVSSNTFAIGQFYHVAGRYDGTNFTLYVNGNVEGQLASTAAISAATAWSI